MADLATCISRKYFKAWFLYILCFISLPSTTVNCIGLSSVSIYPEGDFYIQFGNPLEIFCVAGQNGSANDIQFTTEGKQIDSEIVNSTTRRLYIEEPEKQVRTYYCRNHKENKMCASLVCIDSTPSDVKDFNCVSQNLERIKCSWRSPDAVTRIHYKVSFYVKSHLVSPYCEGTHYCVWDTTSAPRYRQQQEELVFNLKACNVFGCNTQNFTIDHYAIVKPSPPYKLRESRRGAHSVVLKWRVDNNVVDFLTCGVDHAIEYQIPERDKGTYFRAVETSHLPKRNTTYTFSLTDLPYAHMQYEVRIRIKPTKATETQFWSKYEYIRFTTSSEIPKRPPTIKAGSFEQMILNENERVVTVYWQQLLDFEEAGPDFKYKVLVNQGDTPRTIFADETMSHVSFNASHEAVDIAVWSTNVNGSSLNSSHIYIAPVKDTQNLSVTCFTKLNYENGTYLLTWDGLDKNIDYYTLLWCEHTNQICSGRIIYDVLDSKTTRHVIHFQLIQNSYQFGISANRGASSSGITWAKIYGTHTNRCECITR